jgi:hypothetical protein
LALLAAFVFAYALLARRLSTTFLTGPILFRLSAFYRDHSA